LAVISWRLALVAVSASIFFLTSSFLAFFSSMGGKREQGMLTMFVE
jgi:hypothetical protein